MADRRDRVQRSRLLLLPAAASASGLGIKEARTMTRNLYLGADLTPAIGATSLEALTAANGR